MIPLKKAELEKKLSELRSLRSKAEGDLAECDPGLDPDSDFSSPATMYQLVKRLETAASKRDTFRRRLEACGELEALLTAELARVEAEERSETLAAERGRIEVEIRETLADLEQAEDPVEKAQVLSRLVELRTKEVELNA